MIIFHKLLPFVHRGWDEGKGNLCNFYHQVEWMKSFGDGIRIGDRHKKIHIDFEQGLVHLVKEGTDELVRVLAQFKGVAQ